jgi:hypothetical protein
MMLSKKLGLCVVLGLLASAGCLTTDEDALNVAVQDNLSSPPTYSVKLLYFVPRDVAVRSDYQAAIVNGAFATQAYYRIQLAGKTFSFAPTITVCIGDKDQWQYSQNARTQIETEIIARCGVTLNFGSNSSRYLIYADVYQKCGAAAGIGNASANLAMMPKQDLDGLVHALGNLQTQFDTVDDCGMHFTVNANRWIYGTAHELAHTMSIDHPLTGTNAGSVMSLGFYNPANYYSANAPYFLPTDITTLLNSPHIGVVP